jgi:hypothetical protein
MKKAVGSATREFTRTRASALRLDASFYSTSLSNVVFNWQRERHYSSAAKKGSSDAWFNRGGFLSVNVG